MYNQDILSRKKIPLSIIIITYNSDKFIRKNLLSIIDNSIHPKEIIIIDNNSLKPPIKLIKELCLNKIIDISYLENKKNLGFVKAVNQGIKIAKQEYVLLLNPDLFLKENALLQIWKHLEKEKNIVGGKIAEIDGLCIKNTVTNLPSFLTLLIEFTSLRKVFDRVNICNLSNFWDNSANSLRIPSRVDSLSGCLMAIRKSDFIRIGEFDEQFFLYLEDLDFFIRANCLGYSAIFIPKVLGEHFEGGSSSLLPYKINIQAWQKSKRYFSKKHFGFLGKILNTMCDIDDKLITIYKTMKHL